MSERPRRKVWLPLAVAAAVGVTVLSGVLTNSHSASTASLPPGANVGAAINSATPGQTICLEPGTYSSATWREHGGKEGAPVTLTSCDPSNPATLAGRFVTDGSASWVNITNLRFTHSGEAGTVILGTPHVNFLHNDVSGKETICINGVSYGGAQIAYSRIEYNLIHNCGMEGGVPVPTSCNITCQGLYIASGSSNTIANNWCWETAARCYQVRGGDKGVWRNNVAADTQQGGIFGDLTPTNNTVEHNIIGPTKAQSFYTYGSVGAGNVFKDNCVGKAWSGGSSVATSGNVTVTVQYVNAPAHDYTLSAAAVNDPCRAYAASERPGPGGAPVRPPPPPTESTETTPPPPPPAAPPTPTGCKAVPHDEGSTAWIAVSCEPSAGASKYVLYRLPVKSGATEATPWTTSTTPAFANHEQVVQGHRYAYWIAAENATGRSAYASVGVFKA